ncbi:type II toxin-antitoxin system MqsA family antitoxin [Herbaspirillum sp. AP02]|uniref:type II TA system antitoxin MqsA family protein n=1 Tax=unclassified Herbaspirillum TaxID=2624150 RepID=UPI0015DACA5A|nr:type II toxin-antitoxin system MqsA family antitoxin [Herbaspirillum sp. AP02]NZD67043.1 type II toxin-antitoxin system MqsA family antitoxin [Herbaspirillum sp. AP21]
MNCPSCGGAEMVRATRDLPYTYKGETTLIVGVTGDYCPLCGECLPLPAEEERVSSEALAFNKEVNAGLIDPAEITAARELLQLGQREASLLFGGGINAFNRYEAGKIKPPRALVLLLRLLHKHPELLAEVRAVTNDVARPPHILEIREPRAARLTQGRRK